MKKSRILALLLCLCMLVGVLAACSKTDTTTPDASGETEQSGDTAKTGDVVTIRMWGGVPAESGPQAACDAFNEAYKDKGIQVEYERFVNDDTGNVKLETNLLGGNEIDVYMSYTMAQLSKRAEGNMALDLTELCERDGFDLTQYLGDLAKNYYVDGKPFCIPCKLDQYGMVVNKTMFDEAGIAVPTEWTYDEFLDVCAKLTHGEGTDKVYGVFWNSQQDMAQYAQFMIQQTLGGDNMYNADGTATNFTDEVWQKTISLISTTMNEGYAPTHADSVTEKLSQESMFLGGKAAMTIGPWMVRNIKDTETYPHDFVTAFAPYPVVSADQRNYTQGGYGDLLCINPRSEHLDEAWEFAKWYLTEGGLYLASGGRVPAANTYNADDVVNAFLSGAENLFDADSTKAVLITPHDNYAAPSITTKNAELTDIINEELEAIYTGQKTVEEGLESAKTRGDAALAG